MAQEYVKLNCKPETRQTFNDLSTRYGVQMWALVDFAAQEMRKKTHRAKLRHLADKHPQRNY